MTAITHPLASDIRKNASEFSSSPNRLTPAEVERNQRIEENLHLVNQVLAKMRRNLPTYVNSDDLHGAGVMGLIAAAQRFVPAQANTFIGYACLRIRGAILDELRRLDPCSRRARYRAKLIQSATQEAAQAVGHAPNDDDVSARLNISAAELERWRETAEPIRVVSLDVDTENEGITARSLHEMIADDDQECVRDRMEKKELMEFVAERIAELPEMPKKILAMYYFEGMRFTEIAETFELTESRICQIHKETVAKLRALIRSERQGIWPKKSRLS